MTDSNLTIVVFDVETTGMIPGKDQVIELSIQRGLGDDAPQDTWRFKPAVPISPQAQAVHGITAEALRDCPPFSSSAKLIRGMLQESDALCGYNIEFDLAFLQAEFRRARVAELDLQNKLLLDPCRLWKRIEPRTLSDAYRRFAGAELEGAHGAEADVRACAAVLPGMLKAFKLENKTWAEVAELCGAGIKNWIGPTNHFQWRDEQPVIGFGKHRNRPLFELQKEDGGSYLRWISQSDFPEHVKLIAKAAQVKSADELKQWIAETFGVSPGR